jgi:cyclopropane fatty-acyl-phospholipid synthase-like methyltransferase
MAVTFRIRDLLRPRRDVLAEAPIKPGSRVLDFGCGPGSYTTVAAQMVGEAGKVYALDLHPLAVKQVQFPTAPPGWPMPASTWCCSMTRFTK